MRQVSLDETGIDFHGTEPTQFLWAAARREKGGTVFYGVGHTKNEALVNAEGWYAYGVHFDADEFVVFKLPAERFHEVRFGMAADDFWEE